MDTLRKTIDIEDIVSRYSAGETLKSIGKVHGVREGTIKRRLLLAGVTLPDMSRKTALERYERHIDRSAGVDTCHPWTGYRNEAGYGIFYAGSHSGEARVRAHRWGYINKIGQIPRDTPYVLHTCDNPPCQNLKHWRLGTHLDNIADMISKGRHRFRSNRHPKAKLTISEVNEMRDLYTRHNAPQVYLAKRFGISPAAVHDVVHGKSWKNVA